MRNRTLWARALAVSLLSAVGLAAPALAQNEPNAAPGAGPETPSGPSPLASTGVYGIFVPGPNPAPAINGTTIDFEGFAEDTFIDTQFSSLGVTFSQTPSGRPQIDNSPFHFAHESGSGVGTLGGSTEGGNSAPTLAGIVAEFSPLVSRVGAFMSDTAPLGTYTITIWDSADNVLDTIQVNPVDFPTIASFPNPQGCDEADTGQGGDGLWNGTGCGVWVGFDVGSNTIAKIQLGPSSVSGDNFTIDDFVFGVAEPDLVVSSLVHSPANPTTDDEIQFDATVKNVGDQAAGPSTLSFKIGGESPTDPDALFAIPALAVGETKTVVRTLQLDAQSYINTAVADFNNDVVESNEGNNTATDEYEVTQATVETSLLVYQIVELPTKGTIQGITGPCSVEFPCNLAGSALVYVPDEEEEGEDVFLYQIYDPSTELTSLVTRIDILIARLIGDGLTLTVNLVGNGEVTLDVGGSVVAFCTSSPCVNSFGLNDIVKLQARPLGLSTFVGYSGDCSGTSQIFNLTMNEDKTCTATFNP